MENMNIRQAIETIWELIEALEQAYWEAGEIEHKDRVFNVLQILNREYMEMLKLSVQDHHFDYEVITAAPGHLLPVLRDLSKHGAAVCRRLSTREQLEERLGVYIRAVADDPH